jgi:hypothetical protein
VDCLDVGNLPSDTQLKVLFVTRSPNLFSWYRTIIEELLESGTEVRLLFDSNWSDEGPTEAVREFLIEHPELEIGWTKRGHRLARRLDLVIRAFRNYASYRNGPARHEYYANRQRRYLLGIACPAISRLERLRPLYIGLFRYFWDLAANSRLTYGAVTFIDNKLRPHKAIINDITSYGPDAVVVTPSNLKYAQEPGYLKAAKYLKIPTAIPVPTWDNLTTKGVIPFVPDRLIVWNHEQNIEAQTIHAIPEDRVRISGSPLLDKWFDKGLKPSTRERLERETGVEVTTPYVVYMGSSGNIAPNDGHIAIELADALEEELGPGMGGMKILVRPHPANEKSFHAVKDRRIHTWFRKHGGLLPDTTSEFSLYLAFLEYATCIVGVNTTGMVEAALSGKDVITLNLSQFRGTNTSEADHIKIIAASHIFHESETVKDAAYRIHQKHEGMEIIPREYVDSFIENHVKPFGRSVRAGRVAADIIIELAEQHANSPHQK